MKILVTVKRVVDPYAKVRATPDGSQFDTTGAKFEINPFDEIAVEEAVRLKEKHPGTEIVVLTIGAAQSEEQLRKALAMGADRAVLVETDATLDALGIATELAAQVRQENPDLVLMGKQATDDDNNQVGQMLAAKLGWPQATFASKVELGGGKATVTRETDAGGEVLEFELPGVITADLRLNEPRYIAIPGIIKARSKPLERRLPLACTAAKIRVALYESAPQRAAGKKVSSVDELLSNLKQRGVLA